MIHLGDYELGETIDFTFNTHDDTGAPATLSGTPVISAYVGNSVTQLTAGITLTADFDTVTGLNHVRAVLTSGNGYADNTDISFVITTGTVDAISVVGYVVARCTLGRASAYKRIGTPAGASISADVAVIESQVERLGYIGEMGYGVYYDGAAANTNTVAGTDGTIDNPVSSLTSARTLADALGFQTYYIANASTATLAATHEHWTFVGLSERAFNIVDLGSQDVDGSRFINLTVQGTQGGTQRIYAADCALKDPGAGTTTLNIFAVRCGIVDDISLDGSSDNVMIGCFSLVAGNSAPIVRATGASGTFVMRDQLGGVDLRDLAGSHTVTLEGVGQVIFDASCNVNAAVTLRGVGNKTDNTAGMANLTETAYISNTSIDALLAVIKGAGFAEATDSLEAIRDRGDAAWTTGAGGTPPQLLQSTTINTLTSQTVFTLTAGSSDNDAYNDQIIIITDTVTGEQKAVGEVADYVGGTKEVTLRRDPSVFVMAAGDNVDIIAAPPKVSQIINTVPLIPTAIDRADTATVKLGFAVQNMVGNLPFTTEIDPGTYDLARKAKGATSWNIVDSNIAMSELDGLVYVDRAFDTTTFQPGDSIRITFEGASVTVDGVIYQLFRSTGVEFHTYILDENPTAVDIRTELDTNSTEFAAIRAKTDPITFTVANQVDANLQAIHDDVTAAANLEASAETMVTGTASSGTTSSVVTDITGHGDNTFIGRVLIFRSGTLQYESGVITAYTSATGTFTFATGTFTGAPTTELVVIV